MSEPRPATAIVGAGRLASVIGPAASDAGYGVVTVSSRSLASARRLARRIPGAAATANVAEAVEGARLVLLAVPDGEIAGVATRLRDAGNDGPPGGWARRTVLHHAGSLGTEVLAPLARLGAGTGVLHPMQCLGEPEIARGLVAGSYARVEGDRRGLGAARRLARDLGLKPLTLGETPTAGERVAYHAAASLVSNDLVALIAMAVEILESLGIPPARAREAALSLSRGTLAHVEAGGIDAALTGPVVRGDDATTAAQLRALGRRSRETAEVHRLLSRRLLRLVEDSRAIDPERKRALRRVLEPASRGRGAPGGV